MFIAMRACLPGSKHHSASWDSVPNKCAWVCKDTVTLSNVFFPPSYLLCCYCQLVYRVFRLCVYSFKTLFSLHPSFLSDNRICFAERVETPLILSCLVWEAQKHHFLLQLHRSPLAHPPPLSLTCFLMPATLWTLTWE